MTSLNSPITFNASTGSDTNSGVGPSVAVTGNSASTTASSAVVTGISTTGVSSGDLLFLQSSSGRRFSVISSVDSSTQVTCDDVFANTESGRSWAIGGKRATFDHADSRKVFQEIGPQFKGSIQTETDQTITSPITPVSQNSGMGGFIESASDMKTITLTINDSHFEGGGDSLILKNLKFANSASGTKDKSIFNWNNTHGRLPVTAFDCVFGDQTNPCYELYYGGGSYHSSINMYRCTIQYMTSNIAFRNNQGRQVVHNCLFQNNSSIACGFPGSSSGLTADIRGSIFANQPHGVNNGRAGSIALVNNIFYNCSSTGISYFIGPPNAVVGNLFVNCGTAIDNSNSALSTGNIQNNFFFNNTTKYAHQNFAGSVVADVDLSSDPFVNASGGDFNLNNVFGGGSVLRSTKYTVGG